ncbi:hypothetical protein AVL59_05755 [Streptomyces griseochromogenes]|uniref:Uncharacterized protein n=1 Tax=Streptomyces griseochromogenes TaxID=68214 RepID=A0A1B1ARI6_9ACTN|nr:hypothetical protein AVL59_05755 [Streptomyces griseochromogenes]
MDRLLVRISPAALLAVVRLPLRLDREQIRALVRLRPQQRVHPPLDRLDLGQVHVQCSDPPRLRKRDVQHTL